MSPAGPYGIVESRQHVHGNAKGERLRPAQVGIDRPGGGKSMSEIEGHQVALHGRGRERDEGNGAIGKVKLRVEPQIVFHAIVRGPVGCAELEGMRAPAPGDVVLESKTPLVPDIRQDRKSTRLNSSHSSISYAVFCLKKKKLRTKRFVHLLTTAHGFEKP